MENIINFHSSLASKIWTSMMVFVWFRVWGTDWKVETESCQLSILGPWAKPLALNCSRGGTPSLTLLPDPSFFTSFNKERKKNHYYATCMWIRRRTINVVWNLFAARCYYSFNQRIDRVLTHTRILNLVICTLSLGCCAFDFISRLFTLICKSADCNLSQSWSTNPVPK